MKIALFYHSLCSDWNHGNAHFLRGIAWELIGLGHDVQVFEPSDAWSARELAAEFGPEALLGFESHYAGLRTRRYDLATVDLDEALDGVQLVIVHEWNEPALVARLGRYRARRRTFRLLFHDTHHRSVTRPEEMRRYDLAYYDGVLAFGELVRQCYLEEGWTEKAWTWHEAADTRVFRPRIAEQDADLVWIGNWGDDERSDDLREYLIDPVRRLGLTGRVYGVRYPDDARRLLTESGLEHCGWLPNYLAPEAFARGRVTVHVPRRAYVDLLPGVPTIRVFEALACGIPLVCAPWDDAEHLFLPGADYLVARSSAEMANLLHFVINDREAAETLARQGRATILSRHTCAHRVRELLGIVRSLDAPRRPVPVRLQAFPA